MSAINQPKKPGDDEFARIAGEVIEQVEKEEPQSPKPGLVGELLRQALTEHHRIAQLHEELQNLRSDYIVRIGGMIKAIAAASRRRDALAVAEEEVAALPKMTVMQLIERHRRVSARFRDAFPAGFGGLEVAGGSTGRPPRA